MFEKPMIKRWSIALCTIALLAMLLPSLAIFSATAQVAGGKSPSETAAPPVDGEEMGTMETVYLISFFAGLAFAVITGLLGGVFGGHAETAGDIDVGGGLHGHLGHDASGSVDGSGSEVHLSPVSPVTIAMFVATFGGTGIILIKIAKAPLYVHFPVSLASGLIVAGLVFYLFYKIFSVTSSSSEPHAGEAVGCEAEVTTTIPTDGVGEISYILKESRFNGPARTVDNTSIPSHTTVKVVKIVGNIFYVEKSH